MIYVICLLLVYIAAALTYLAINKVKEKAEKKEPKKRTMYSKSSYSTPLQTYKEYEQFKDKKSKLYAPITPKGRGEKIIKKEE